MKPVVLIVEDEDVFRETLAAIIRDEGYTVLCEPAALSALEVMDKEPVDIVLTDVRMPGMNGIEFLEKTRCHADADVIVMSAYGTTEESVEAIKKGACDYITKPFLFDDMLERLKRLCEHRSRG